MKRKITIALSAVLLSAASLVAANVNGFENFVLSRNDGHVSEPVAISDFSSRTYTVLSCGLDRFSSYKSTGVLLIIQ